MNITYKMHHIDMTDSLKQYFEKRISKIDNYKHLINNIEVYFEHDSYIYSVELLIEFRKWKKVFFSSQDIDMYKAIDQLIDRVQSSIERHKMRIVDHKKESIRKKATIFQDTEKEVVEIASINLDDLNKKPMEIIDALYHLEQKKEYEFYIFYNFEKENHHVHPAIAIKLNKKQYIIVEHLQDISNKIKHEIVSKDSKNKIKTIKEDLIPIKELSISEAKKQCKNHYLFFINKETSNQNLLIQDALNSYKLLDISDIA